MSPRITMFCVRRIPPAFFIEDLVKGKNVK